MRNWSTQYGIEFKRAWRLDFPPMRPVIAADIKHYDENSRSRDISVCAGVDFDKSKHGDANCRFWSNT
ncbi:DUF1207 domain-containing protein [Methylomonas sp. HW2-6]|uniref:DUF1207 domain-containing protein n=1 Tax=Methylomonas sp. HW2-6 TaxID=3376687 RepID=UPI0040417AED